MMRKNLLASLVIADTLTVSPNKLTDGEIEDERDAAESGLQILLRELGPDTATAGQEYEKVRTRLCKLFEMNRCPDPNGMVDRVFERVEKKLEDVARDPAENKKVRNIFGFMTGVARNVLREYWVSPEIRTQEIDRDLPDRYLERDEDGPRQEDRRLDCLDLCLSCLSHKMQRQLLDYHSGTGRHGINIRKQIADEENVPMENLRVTMLRSRRDLEKCILKCLGNSRDAQALPIK